MILIVKPYFSVIIYYVFKNITGFVHNAALSNASSVTEDRNFKMDIVGHKSIKNRVIETIQKWRGSYVYKNDTLEKIRQEAKMFTGKYSIERQARFIEYGKTHSRKQQILHCIVPMVVSVLTTIMVMALPYEKVSDGFFKNGVIPITLFVGGTISLLTLMRLFEYYFKEARVSHFEVTWVAALGGSVYTITISLLTIFVCYPMPFSLIFPCFISMPTVAIACYVVFGKRIRHLKKFKPAMTGFFYFTFLVIAMLNVYPFFLQITQILKGTILETFGMPVLLHLLKNGIKHFMRKANSYADEPHPYVPVLAINAFHIVYVSITLQKGASINSLLLLMAMDLFGNMLQLIQMRTLLTLSFREQKLTTASKIHCSSSTNTTAPKATTTLQSTSIESDSSPKVNSIPNATSTARTKSTTTQHQNVVERKLLYLTENMFLIEYVECIVPFQFSILSITFFFHPNGAYMTLFLRDTFTRQVLEQTVQSLLLYTLLEVFFLQLLGHIVVGRMKIPFLTQIAFVLYESATFSSTMLNFWLLYALSGTLAHVGHDWTFQFAWECIKAY